MTTTINKLDELKKLRYNTFSSNIGFIHVIKKYDLKSFEDHCEKIIQGGDRVNRMNKKLSDNMVFHLTNNNPTKLRDVIFNVLTRHTTTLCNTIQQSVYNDTLSIQSFMNVYRKYEQVCKSLEYSLWYFVNSTSQRRGNKKYSYLSLMKNYLFYSNVVNHQYKLTKETYLGELSSFMFSSLSQPQSQYLFEIFIKKLDDISEDEILFLFNTISFYNKFSRVAGFNREKTFNTVLDSQFLKLIYANEKVIKFMTTRLNNLIINLQESYDKKLFDKTKKIIQTLSLSSNNKLFSTLYKTHLLTRLEKNTTFNSNTEIKLIKHTTNKLSQFANMVIMIEDYVENKVINEMYQSTKFIPIITRGLNDIDNKKYIISPNLTSHITDFEEFYSEKFANRKLIWNFNKGNALINIKLGDTEYTFETTIPQMLILNQFNNDYNTDNTVTAQSISDNCGIQLSELDGMLQKLIDIKLIDSDGDVTSSDIKFTLNESFTDINNSISLIYL